MEKEIIKKSKVIAEFMGSEFDGNNVRAVKNYPTGIEGWFYDTNSYLKFNSSWDWLMPVVEKIEIIKDDHHGYFGVWINSNCCTIQGTALHLALNDLENYGAVYFNEEYADTKLQATFEAVYEFIKWYNEK